MVEKEIGKCLVDLAVQIHLENGINRVINRLVE